MATSIDSTHPEVVEAITSGAAGGSHPSVPALPAAQAPPPEPLPRSIEDFDKIIAEDVTAFVAASEKLDDLVAEQVNER